MHFLIWKGEHFNLEILNIVPHLIGGGLHWLFISGFLHTIRNFNWLICLFLGHDISPFSGLQELHISPKVLLKALVKTKPLILLASFPSTRISTSGIEVTLNLLHNPLK